MDQLTLTSQLREAAGYLWPDIVRYTFVDAVVGVIGYAVSITVLVVLNVVLYRSLDAAYWRAVAKNDVRVDRADYAIPEWVAIGISLGFGFMLLVGLANSVTAAIAPEGAAVMKMLHSVK